MLNFEGWTLTINTPGKSPVTTAALDKTTGADATDGDHFYTSLLRCRQATARRG